MVICSPLDTLTVPVLHGDPRLLSGPFWTTWRISPSVAVGVFGLVAAYLAWVGPLNRRRPDPGDRPVHRGQVAAFLGGALTLLIALGPPLEDWAELLLSGHMVQHLLLTLVVPPLLLLGTPAWVLAPVLRWRAVAQVGYVLTRPVVAFALASAVIVLWHIPVLYDASLRSVPIHVLQHQLFLITGVLAWWPLVGPLPAWPRLSLPVQCLYLFLLTIPGGVVGANITLATPGLYAPYMEVPRMWGIELAVDQEAGGLIMWVGTNTIYLALISVVFFRWAAREEAVDRRPATPVARQADGIHHLNGQGEKIGREVVGQQRHREEDL